MQRHSQGAMYRYTCENHRQGWQIRNVAMPVTWRRTWLLQRSGRQAAGRLNTSPNAIGLVPRLRCCSLTLSCAPGTVEQPGQLPLGCRALGAPWRYSECRGSSHIAPQSRQAPARTVAQPQDVHWPVYTARAQGGASPPCWGPSLGGQARCTQPAGTRQG